MVPQKRHMPRQMPPRRNSQHLRQEPFQRHRALERTRRSRAAGRQDLDTRDRPAAVVLAGNAVRYRLLISLISLISLAALAELAANLTRFEIISVDVPVGRIRFKRVHEYVEIACNDILSCNR